MIPISDIGDADTDDYLISKIPIPIPDIDDSDTDTDNDEIANDTIARSIRREGLHDQCSTSVS